VSTFGWYRPWLTGVQDDTTVPMRGKAVAAALARFERQGIVRKSAGQIAAAAGCDERTARRALGDLKAAGWVNWSRSRDHLVVTLQSGQIARTDGQIVRSSPVKSPDTSTRATSLCHLTIVPSGTSWDACEDEIGVAA
jgi:hypothetical protein